MLLSLLFGLSVAAAATSASASVHDRFPSTPSSPFSFYSYVLSFLLLLLLYSELLHPYQISSGHSPPRSGTAVGLGSQDEAEAAAEAEHEVGSGMGIRAAANRYRERMLDQYFTRYQQVQTFILIQCSIFTAFFCWYW